MLRKYAMVEHPLVKAAALALGGAGAVLGFTWRVSEKVSNVQGSVTELVEFKKEQIERNEKTGNTLTRVETIVEMLALREGITPPPKK